MVKRFEPIFDKCGEIVEWLLSSPDVPADDEIQFKVRLSVEEAVENIVRYAYENGSGYLEASTAQEDNMLVITLKDAGTPFDPLAKPDPDINAELEDRQIGGLGIFLCKQLMDGIYYQFVDGCNLLTLKKRLA